MLRPSMIALLSTTWVGVPLAALGYLAGIAACAFHLVNGLASFVASAGLIGSAAARTRATWIAGALGLAVMLLGAETVVALATGAAHFGQ
jgi:succinate dehydrogenase/fumarate reductase cytochrome b subunit